ncbi:MAG: biopolymer transporter ExbD [Phycisphaerae bacterium]|nr:biopolymer transporter ExbD [Gemmatimonadaceae bacterium]
MRGRRRRTAMAVNGEINVVSLIDVMMLLMVIFMITAPMMQGGVDIALPKADAPALESKSAIIVSLSRDGQISVDGKKWTRPEFERSFAALAAQKGKDGVYVQADKDVPSGELIKLLALLGAAGVANAGIVTEPPEGNQ